MTQLQYSKNESDFNVELLQEFGRAFLINNRDLKRTILYDPRWRYPEVWRQFGITPQTLQTREAYDAWINRLQTMVDTRLADDPIRGPIAYELIDQLRTEHIYKFLRDRARINGFLQEQAPNTNLPRGASNANNRATRVQNAKSIQQSINASDSTTPAAQANVTQIKGLFDIIPMDAIRALASIVMPYLIRQAIPPAEQPVQDNFLQKFMDEFPKKSLKSNHV